MLFQFRETIRIQSNLVNGLRRRKVDVIMQKAEKTGNKPFFKPSKKAVLNLKRCYTTYTIVFYTRLYIYIYIYTCYILYTKLISHYIQLL